MISRSAVWMAAGLLITGTASAMPFPWKPVDPQPPEKIVHIEPDGDVSGSLMAVGVGGSLYRSSDWGQTWSPVHLPPDILVYRIWDRPRSRDVFYATAGESDREHSLWITEDAGDSFRKLGGLPGPDTRLAVSPHLPGFLLCVVPGLGNHLSLYLSTDNGANWTEKLSADYTDAFPIWHPTAPWQTFWGPFRSDDTGETWLELNSKDPDGGGYDIPPSIYAATEDGFFASIDDLVSWWPLLIKPVNYVRLNPRDPDQILTGFLSYAPGYVSYLYFSDDGGETFALWSDGMPAQFQSITIAADWLFFAIHEGIVISYDERPADLDGSRRVDGGDLVILSLAFGTFQGEPRYNPVADLNGDGAVDGHDLTILSMVWGHRFYYDDEIPGDFPGGTGRPD